MENFTAPTDHDNLPPKFPQLPGISEDQESNTGFERYWKHYEMMKEWMDDYVAAWKKHRNMLCGQRGMNRRHLQKRSKSRQKTRKQYEESSVTNEINGCNSNSIVPIEKEQSQFDDVTIEHLGKDNDDPQSAEFELEVSEELREFFMKSQKHREEREKRKSDGAKLQGEDLKEGEEEQKTTEAPKERPGVRRNQAMKALYGRHAPMIQGLETAIQMEFDHMLDKEQPELWPSIALNL